MILPSGTACSFGPGKNVGLVRFELTIDGSLRHASVLQRVIIRFQETHCSSPAKTAGARRHSGLGHSPPDDVTGSPFRDLTLVSGRSRREGLRRERGDGARYHVPARATREAAASAA